MKKNNKMRKIFTVLFLFVVSLGHAQHHIHAVFQSLSHSYINYESGTVDPTCIMYEGTIDRDTMRFKQVNDTIDGEIVFAIEYLNLNDEFYISLVDNSNQNMYSYHISGGKFFIEETGKQIGYGDYSSTAEFRIVRCNESILYYYEGELINFTLLDSNEFTMDGRIKAVSVNDSKAEISFHPLN